MKAIAHILATALALLVITHLNIGVIVESFYTALVVAIIWGILGLTVRPILKILTLPINLLTFGLFSFVLNALLFWLLATFISGFHVAGFVPALLGSVILSVVSWALHAAFATE